MSRTKSSRNKNLEPSLNSESFPSISTTPPSTETNEPLAEIIEPVEPVEHDAAETKMFEPVPLVELEKDSDTPQLPPYSMQGCFILDRAHEK